MHKAHLDVADEGVPGSEINMHEVAKGVGASSVFVFYFTCVVTIAPTSCDTERVFSCKRFVIVVTKFNNPTSGNIHINFQYKRRCHINFR